MILMLIILIAMIEIILQFFLDEFIIIWVLIPIIVILLIIGCIWFCRTRRYLLYNLFEIIYLETNSQRKLNHYFPVMCRNLPYILAWKFCGKVQFRKLCGKSQRIPRNSAETVSFHKISTPGN